MKRIKVLGSGCKTCTGVADAIAETAKVLGVEATVEKVTDMAVVMGYGVMSMPGVVIDEKVVHAGGAPSRAQIEAWLKD
jgi:small redox-active disulfide protein 2